MKIQNKRVLITGASGGIGQAIARDLVEHKANVVLTGRRQDVLEGLAKELKCDFQVCDLSNPTELDKLIETIGSIDIYVANAGIPGAGSTFDLGPEEIDRTIDVNLRAPIHSSMAFAREMAKQGSGHIVFISSIAGLVTSPTTTLYCATKFGLRGFALSLRQELSDKNIGVSVILPGFINEAGMFANAKVDLPKVTRTKSPQDVSKAVIRAITDNKAEILVAPAELRFGSKLASVFPYLAEFVQNSRSAREAAAKLQQAQRNVK